MPTLYEVYEDVPRFAAQCRRETELREFISDNMDDDSMDEQLDAAITELAHIVRRRA